jgi:integrase
MQIVTPQFLKDYESWMLKFGKASQKKDGEPTAASISTVGINCRNLRTVFNEAVAAGVINENLYPFGKGKYRIPKANNKKKALDEGVVLKIWSYICEAGSERSKARDLWMFSYLCNGLNFTDICQIKRSEYDAGNGNIEIYRQKSKNTKREEMTKIHISLLPEAIEIIEEWGNLDRKKDSYLFPFITDDMSADRKKAVIKQVIKNTNYNMNKIAKALEIDVPINTYEARHTFATTLLRSEAPLAFISQSLGHSSFKTTQAQK